LKASPHGALDCVSCHADIKEVPRAVKLAGVDCEAAIRISRDRMRTRSDTVIVTEGMTLVEFEPRSSTGVPAVRGEGGLDAVLNGRRPSGMCDSGGGWGSRL
jgi:hypothetical protein